MSNHDEARRWRAAFEAVALEHFDFLSNVAMSFTRNPAEAQDLVQETYCKAYRFFYRFQPGTHMKAWLVTILRNTFIHTCRKASRQPERMDFEQVALLCARTALAPEWTEKASVEEILRHVVQDEVKQALDEVPEAYRLVVVLADLGECSYKDIAAIVGCPVGTVMSRLFRGRRMLRKRLATFARQSGYLRSRQPCAAGAPDPGWKSVPHTEEQMVAAAGHVVCHPCV